MTKLKFTVMMTTQNKVDQFFLTLDRYAPEEESLYWLERIKEWGTDDDGLEEVLKAINPQEVETFRRLVQQDPRASWIDKGGKIHSLTVEELVKSDFSGANRGKMLGLWESRLLTDSTQQTSFIAKRSSEEKELFWKEAGDSILSNLPRLGGMVAALGVSIPLGGIGLPLVVGTAVGAWLEFILLSFEHTLRGKKIDWGDITLTAISDSFSSAMSVSVGRGVSLGLAALSVYFPKSLLVNLCTSGIIRGTIVNEVIGLAHGVKNAGVSRLMKGEWEWNFGVEDAIISGFSGAVGGGWGRYLQDYWKRELLCEVGREFGENILQTRFDRSTNGDIEVRDYVEQFVLSWSEVGGSLGGARGGHIGRVLEAVKLAEGVKTWNWDIVKVEEKLGIVSRELEYGVNTSLINTFITYLTFFNPDQRVTFLNKTVLNILDRGHAKTATQVMLHCLPSIPDSFRVHLYPRIHDLSRRFWNHSHYSEDKYRNEVSALVDYLPEDQQADLFCMEATRDPNGIHPSGISFRHPCLSLFSDKLRNHAKKEKLVEALFGKLKRGMRDPEIHRRDEELLLWCRNIVDNIIAGRLLHLPTILILLGKYQEYLHFFHPNTVGQLLEEPNIARRNGLPSVGAKIAAMEDTAIDDKNLYDLGIQVRDEIFRGVGKKTEEAIPMLVLPPSSSAFEQEILIECLIYLGVLKPGYIYRYQLTCSGPLTPEAQYIEIALHVAQTIRFAYPKQLQIDVDVKTESPCLNGVEGYTRDVMTGKKTQDPRFDYIMLALCVPGNAKDLVRKALAKPDSPNLLLAYVREEVRRVFPSFDGTGPVIDFLNKRPKEPNLELGAEIVVDTLKRKFGVNLEGWGNSHWPILKAAQLLTWGMQAKPSTKQRKVFNDYKSEMEALFQQYNIRDALTQSWIGRKWDEVYPYLAMVDNAIVHEKKFEQEVSDLVRKKVEELEGLLQ